MFIRCKDKNPNIHKVYEDDFQNKINLKENRKATKEMLNVRDLFVQDSLLLVNNSKTDTIFKIFSLNSFTCINSWGIEGRGPEEYGTYKYLIRVSSKKFQIADFSKSWIETYTIPDFTLEKKQKIKNNKPSGIREIPQRIVTSDGIHYYYDNLFRQKLSIKKWRNGEKPFIINDFSHIKESFGSPTFYTGELAINTKKNKLIYAYNYLRRFDIMDLNGEIIKIIEVLPSAPSPVERSNSNYVPESTMCYMGIRADDDSFFLYYVGYPPTELEENDMLLPCYIEEYDWKGNPLNRYKLNQYISTFDIIENGKQNVSFVGVDITRKNPLIVYQ